MLSEKEKRILTQCEADMDDMEFKEVNLEKNNQQVLRGIRVAKKGAPLGLVVYWDDISRIYGENYYEETGVYYISKMVRDYLNVDMSYETVEDWSLAKGLVCRKVINYERNKDRIKKLVHRPYMDLAEVYYLKIPVLGEGVGTTEVTESLLSYWGISREELARQAEENMRQEDYCIHAIQEILAEYDMPVPLEGPSLYVVTNQNKLLGAGILTNTAFLREVLGEQNRDYFILPSSIHEIILCPDNGWTDVSELKNLVYEVNRTAVSEGDFLSDSVYYYHADTGTIEICGEVEK